MTAMNAMRYDCNWRERARPQTGAIPRRSRQSWLSAYAPCSDLGLFRDLQSVIDLDTEERTCAFEFRMA